MSVLGRRGFLQLFGAGALAGGTLAATAPSVSPLAPPAPATSAPRFMTLAETLAEEGDDWQRIVDEAAVEAEKIKALGLSPIIEPFGFSTDVPAGQLLPFFFAEVSSPELDFDGGAQ